jgi:pimeloyl-ACP methyl ester carboxylesterase
MDNISPHEQRELERANDSGRHPVVFVHGLWLLASSWDRWRRLFELEGYVALAPSWPDDPENVEEARRHPEALAGKKVQRVTDHFANVIGQLKLRPAIVGHSSGALIAQKLAGMGLSPVTVAIDPAPFRGVLPLPLSALRVASAALRNPANYKRAVPLSFEQFRYGFANAVDESEARELYEAYAVAAPGALLFQAATANLNPGTEARVNTMNPARGPLLIISGEKDHTVPLSMANAAYRRQKRNPGITEFRAIGDRGHSLVIDSGWQEVAEVALAFVKQHAPTEPLLRWAEQQSSLRA